MTQVKANLTKISSFLTEAIAEFKKVSWPTKDQTIRLTLYVLGVSLGVALFVWGIDLVFKEALSSILLK